MPSVEDWKANYDALARQHGELVDYVYSRGIRFAEYGK